jgi:DNA mismatch repair protein MutS2
VFERAQVIEKLSEEVAAVDEGVKRVQRRERKPRRGPLPAIEPGDRVFLTDVPSPGEAITSPDVAGEFEVMLGSLRARINVKQIANVEKGAAVGQGPSPDYHSRETEQITAMPRPSPELDLRGMTVDEALPLVDQRLDDAARAGIAELRIIHGKGTGTLRHAVREMLRKHALVRTSASAESRAGGDGVTVVEIAE